MLSFCSREHLFQPPQITPMLTRCLYEGGVMHLISPLGGKGLRSITVLVVPNIYWSLQRV